MAELQRGPAHVHSETPGGSEPEVLWMQRTADGDTEAFRRLVARYEKQILNLAYRYCGDPQASQDLSQEIFLKVYLNANRWKPKARFSTWLFRVAVNHCLNYRRDRKRDPLRAAASARTDSCPGGAQEALPLDGRGNPIGASGPAAADPDRREVDLRVRRAVLALPARQRMALILQRYHGLSYREIAERMDCSQGAVESLLVRAAEHLRATLADLIKEE
ncbi:MAG: sigma-70 family RNA polymerase sigma factor [bacterium]